MTGHRFRQYYHDRSARLLLSTVVIGGITTYVIATGEIAQTAVPQLQEQMQAAGAMTPQSAVPLPLTLEQAADANPEQTPFLLYQNNQFIGGYEDYVSAIDEAKLHSGTEVHFKKKGVAIWSGSDPAGEAHIDAPLIYQMPELERGCEVTSLAMLLQHAGIDIDKMTLADKIRRDPTPYELYDHMIHFGNPNNGFVGEITTFDEPGYGVYHGPVVELAEKYLPGRVIDATGTEFDDLLPFLDQGIPVWVIVNMDYQALDEDAFETWDTPDGGIDITYLEHSVLVTGYDADAIYFNDPLGEDEQASRDDFIAAWEQMGRQAITYVINGQES